MSARYQIQDHPDFTDLLTREDLYVLNDRGSIARGDICLDRITGRSHTVGEVISGVVRARQADGETRVGRPAYVEIRGDGASFGADEEDDLDEEEEDEEEEGVLGYTSSGERVFFHGHPSWLAYMKAWLLCLLLVIAGALGSTFGMIYLVLGLACASTTFMCIAVTRFSKDYFVTEDRVEVLWGLIGRSSKEVRICDIRSIDVRERWITGMLGLGSVDFSSAANAGIEVTFEMVRGSHRVKELVRQLQVGESRGD